MTQPTDTAYVRHIAALAIAIREKDIRGYPFDQLTTQNLDALGADTKVFRKRRSTLMREGYIWEEATDVATYEALQAIGLLPQA